MKMIIAGGRNYQLAAEGFRLLDHLLRALPVTEVVTGRATGIDASGERWARARGLPVKHFPADWKYHGKAAGPIRNQEMANYADALAVFHGGRGTRDMRRKAEAAGLQVFDYRDVLYAASRID